MTNYQHMHKLSIEITNYAYVDSDPYNIQF